MSRILTLLIILNGRAAEVAQEGTGPPPGPGALQIDWNSDLCKIQKRYLESQIKSRVTADQLASAIAKKSPKVVLIGEAHAEETPEFYKHFFHRVKKAMPSLNCVAFETSRGMVKRSGSLRPAWKALADVAKKSFASVHYVDEYLDEHEEEDKPGSPAAFAGGVNERSRQMAGHLANLLKTGRCSKILMINGALHLIENPADQRPGIPQRLRDAHVSTFNILSVDLTTSDPHRRRNSRDTWLWPKGPPPGSNWGNPASWDARCADVPGQIGENYAVLNENQPLAKQVPVAYYNNEYGKIGPISQFDALLMLQCPKSPNTICPVTSKEKGR